MESLEISAKTVEEATQRALEQLGVGREEVEVTVVKEGKSGILGLGAEEAVIRVTPLAPVAKSDVAETAKSVLEKLLALMGMTGVTVTQPPATVEKEGETEDSVALNLNIEGDDLGILIGHRGQTLSSLQYMVRLIIGHQTGSGLPIVIDVEGYKQRRYQALEALARRLAEQVKMKGVPFTLEPMSSYERRIIHLTLADDPDVTTESIGEGEARKVVILLKEA